MDYFWLGFEKRAGAITDALRRLGMNEPGVRKRLAEQIKKNRRSLAGRAGEMEAGVVHGDRGFVVDHAAHGTPSTVIEKLPGSKSKQIKLKAA